MTRIDSNARTDTNSGAIKWLMGIVAALFIAMAVGAVSIPYSAMRDKVHEHTEQIRALEVESKESSNQVVEMRSDIRYIKQAVDRLEKKVSPQ